jgi:predicted flap endonuclease-1-like 5' DNA nuclease
MRACETLARHYADHAPTFWVNLHEPGKVALEQTLIVPWMDHRWLTRAADLHVRAGEAWFGIWLAAADPWGSASRGRARGVRPQGDGQETAAEASPPAVRHAVAAGAARPTATIIALRSKSEPPPLLRAPRGAPDDLSRIKGVGARLHALLNEIGIYHFWQLADLSAGQTAWLEARLRCPGRASRDRWREQARAFAKG